jgi:hypothetical protein
VRLGRNLQDSELTLGRTNSFEKLPGFSLQLAFFFFEFRRRTAKFLEHCSVGEDRFCDQFGGVSLVSLQSRTTPSGVGLSPHLTSAVRMVFTGKQPQPKSDAMTIPRITAG